MNKNLYFLPLFLLAFLFASCEETTEVSEYDNWQPRNQAYIDDLLNEYLTKPDHGGLDSIHLISAPNKYIFYRKLTPAVAEGATPVIAPVSPLYTQTVTVYYKGTLITDVQFDGNFSGADPSINFDKPTDYQVNKMIIGWVEVLQRMQLGERWKIYVPYEFAYGVNGSGSIPGYSTLIFDMQLAAIDGKSAADMMPAEK